MSTGPSKSDSFVHLHVHTEYSMLDGAAKIDDLFAEAARMGMPAVATTDHGFVFGAYEFWKKAKKHGVKPIVGIEAYLTPGTARQDRTRVRWGDGGEDDVSGTGAYTHMTLLARTTGGMHNLFRLASLASLEGQFYKPRMDRELLTTYGDGLIATTGCPSGEVQTKLRLGQYEAAREAAADFRDIFGAENFYCELMDHGLGIERRVQKDLLRLARDLGLPLVATNDLHYTRAEDAQAHAVLLCVQSGSTLADPKRFKFDADEFYLKSPAEMRHLWRELPEACDNTLLIAERCDVSFTEGEGQYMPRFPCPEGENEESWFVREVETGLHRRYPEGVPDDVRKQAAYEIEVITSKGYAGYFLVVADFINWAKEHGIRVGPGRGSGAGSMCAYAMRITDLDPLQHGLIFERFLNPERMSMPDFDVDFDERRRGEVIRYVTERYGDDRVAQIVTYGTIKAKQALKDAGRVLGYPFSLGERMTKAMPPAVMGKDIPLSGIFDPEHPRYKEAEEFRQLHASDPDVARVVETARGLENLKRQWGVHAAGVIMSSEPLVDLVPIMRREQDGQIITQFDYPTCESLGLVKMDFLGLRNLTILDDALVNVKANRGVDIDLDALSKDPTDPVTYDLLARGDTLGVFQFDGGPMRALLRLMRPDNFEDISAVGALYRPGPMGANSHTNYALRKNKQQDVTYLHPDLAEALEPILGTTYGLIVYQEQVMAIAQQLAGYTLGKADLLRRAMGKKKREVLDAEYVGFEKGMLERGFSAAVDQGVVGRPGPVLRLRVQQGALGRLRPRLLLDRLSQGQLPGRVHGRAPDQRPGRQGQVGPVPQRVPPAGHQGAPAGRQRVRRRTSPRSAPTSASASRPSATSGPTSSRRSSRPASEKGRYASFEDFLRKVPVVVCNKRTIESLIKAGAFDDLGHTRRGLIAVHEAAVDAVVSDKRQEAIGQDSLFGGLDDERPDAVRRPARARGGVGQADPACPPSGRCSGSTCPTTRSSASSTSSPGRRTPPSRPDRRRRPAGRRHRDDRGHDQLAPAQDDQERQPLGDRHRRGPRRRHRGAVLPAGLPDRVARAGGGPGRGRPRSGEPPRRRPDDLRAGADPAGPGRGPPRAGGRRAARHPVHPTGGGTAQGRPGDASRPHRGAPAAHPAREDNGDAPRRRSAGHPDARPVRRSQGSARSELPRLTQPCTGSDRGARCESACRLRPR